jgi:hypothetical protein
MNRGDISAHHSLRTKQIEARACAPLESRASPTYAIACRLRTQHDRHGPRFSVLGFAMRRPDAAQQTGTL